MLTNFKLSSEELAMLNYERYYYPCPLVQKRLHCLYLKGSLGLSNNKIGELMDAHRNSISEWVSIYGKDGFDALTKVGYGTNKSEIEKSATGIIASFTSQPPRSLGEAMLKVEELTKIKRSPTSIRKFMNRHNFRFLKTGHIPAKVNTMQQHSWVDDTLKPVIEAAKEGKVHLLF